MKVTVVGGGVIGLACAWELMRGGADVIVVERGSIGAGCSLGNAGWVCPSIAAPLPEPGMVREGVLQLVRRRNAFVLHPRFDSTFARWLWTFARSCRPARFEHGERAMQALLDPTLEPLPVVRYGPEVPVMVVDPTATLVTSPRADTVATPVALLVQVITRPVNT